MVHKTTIHFDYEQETRDKKKLDIGAFSQLVETTNEVLKCHEFKLLSTILKIIISKHTLIKEMPRAYVLNYSMNKVKELCSAAVDDNTNLWIDACWIVSTGMQQHNRTGL